MGSARIPTDDFTSTATGADSSDCGGGKYWAVAVDFPFWKL